MKRALIVASVASMIQQFNMPNIRLLLRMGYKVDVACNFEQGNTCTQEMVAELKDELGKLGVACIQIDFARNVLKVRKNLKALSQLKMLMDAGTYCFVHCHSPIGGMLTRIAGRLTKTPVIYTAHGFHYYKGAPLLNWLIYFPIEWICGFWTNVLITINREDYEIASKRIKAGKVYLLPGVGVDVELFGSAKVPPVDVRTSLGVPKGKIWLFNVGELITRKNQDTLLHAVANLPEVFLTIAGKGPQQTLLENTIKELGIESRVKLLGFRTDISDLCNSADVFVFPSFQEGLSVALMEAMAAGKPCVVSRIRGNTDLIDEAGGEFFNPADAEDIGRAIDRMLSRDMVAVGEYNRKKIVKFSVENVMRLTEDIYREL